MEKGKKTSKKINIEQVDKKISEKKSKITSYKKEEQQSINKEQNKYGIFEIVLVVVITSLIFSLVGYFIGIKSNLIGDVNYSTASKEIQKFIEEYNYILENYYGDIDKEELVSSAIKGMLSSLDEYSEFVGDDSSNFSITLEGEYEGLGVGISSTTDNEIIITTIYPNSPADKAGLKVGDIITKFNNESVEGLSTTELVDKISQTEEINLTVLREEELTFNLKKDKIVIESVHSEMKDNNIGYIKVDIFANNTYSQFHQALEDLEKQNMESLIIDLRSNGGGHLSAAKDILSLFLNDTHVIYQTEDKNGIEKFYSEGNEDKNYKIVILQNSISASASEVVTSCLKEQLGAYVIGTTSYGKGTVQNLQNVSGIGQYKVTTKKWLTSNGEWINEVGIKPDLEVNLSEKYFKNPSLDTDDQYQAAIKYLKES